MMQRRGTDDPSGHGRLSQLGMVVAGQPARAVQPRLLRSRRQAVGSRRAARSGGTKRQQRWVGPDVPDIKVDSPPKDHMGPFIMNREGVGRLFVPLAGLTDGPFPEHYEPTESPVANPLHPNQSTNPIAKKFKSRSGQVRHLGEGYNIVCTTYRLTEHYHYWTKNNPMNVQLMPEPFVEIPAELADELGPARRREGQGHQRPRPLHRQGHGDAAASSP